MCSFKKKAFQLGNLKRLEDMSLSDFTEHPIWVADLSGECDDGFDETSQRPVVGTCDVTKSMLKEFVSVSVLIAISGTDIQGTADVSEDLNLSTLCLWQDDEWKSPKEIRGFPEDAHVEVIPTIEGQENLRLSYDPRSDIATR
jgi:hypothetical protein